MSNKKKVHVVELMLEYELHLKYEITNQKIILYIREVIQYIVCVCVQTSIYEIQTNLVLVKSAISCSRYQTYLNDLV